jgi:hypothetical protein
MRSFQRSTYQCFRAKEVKLLTRPTSQSQPYNSLDRSPRLAFLHLFFGFHVVHNDPAAGHQPRLRGPGLLSFI